MDAARVGARIAHFRIVEPLGQGGMGIVYKAVDERLDRTVALKLLRPEHVGSAARRARFLREARSAAAVAHPNIAAVHEVGEADGEAYIAMELVEGRTLRAFQDGRPLPLAVVLPIAIDVAGALQAAHERGFAHRDLKPDNVMIAPSGGVKVLDFGLAKALGVRESEPSADDAPTVVRTRDGAMLGTPGYMAPEQLRGHGVDQRADVFAFGALLHELCTGRAPFSRPTEIDTMAAVIGEAAPSAASLVSGLPARIDWIRWPGVGVLLTVAWSADGAAIYGTLSDGDDVVRLDPDGTSRSVWSGEGWPFRVVSSPDGAHLAVAVRRATRDAWRADGL